tara:strand:+ start:25 stop:207 length:183 start_codon:yes stop_codon:yes gene_type:complete
MTFEEWWEIHKNPNYTLSEIDLKAAFEAGHNSCIDAVVNVRSRWGDYVEIHVEDLEEMKK